MLVFLVRVVCLHVQCTWCHSQHGLAVHAHVSYMCKMRQFKSCMRVFAHVLLVDICPAEIIYTNLLLCHLKEFRRGVRSLYVLDKLLFLAVIAVDWCSAKGNSFSKLEERLELKKIKNKKTSCEVIVTTSTYVSLVVIPLYVVYFLLWCWGCWDLPTDIWTLKCYCFLAAPTFCPFDIKTVARVFLSFFSLKA